MKDFKIDPHKQDYETSGGQYVLTDNIMNNIYLSLNIRKGSWPFAPDFGSRLHLLMREKALVRVERLVKQYCDEALKWIIDAGRADSIEVAAELDKDNARIKCLITAEQKGQIVKYEQFVEVR